MVDENVYTQKLNEILDTVKKQRKYSWIAWALVALFFGIFIWSTFFRAHPKDFFALDIEKQKLVDSIAARDRYIQVIEEQRDEAVTEAMNSEQSRKRMEEQYISNQEKHVIINKKDNNEIDAAVRLFELQKLRDEFLRTKR